MPVPICECRWLLIGWGYQPNERDKMTEEQKIAYARLAYALIREQGAVAKDDED